MEDHIYHIYNRGNNSQPIFFEDENYEFFLKKVKRHLAPIVDVLAYCLMPNHFHLLVSVKEPSDGSEPSDGLEVNRAIGVILRSYTQGVNKRFNRTGSLFQQKTQFKPLKNDYHAKICFHYIHQNPLKARLVSALENWHYSSFNSYFSQDNGNLVNLNVAYQMLDIPVKGKVFYKESYEVINSVDFSFAEEFVQDRRLFDSDLAHDPSGRSAMKIGLVLSGGGVRGVAHLGVIKALEEYNVKIDCISGTSAGAIIGAFYGSGRKVDDILKIITEIKAFKFMQPAMSWKGILNMGTVEKFLEKYLPNDSFSNLKIPLHVTATNLRTGKSESFDRGSLRKIICASSCIPVMFDPVEINGELYIDGGILNNLPVEPIKDKCDFVIGSHSNPVGGNFKPKNARAVMERALMMAITQNVYHRKAQCDIYIEPKGLEPYKVLDFNKSQEIFEIGYKYALKKLKSENLLEKLR